MKLRIRGNTLRLRLTRPEVEALHEHGKVEDASAFPDGARFRYALELAATTTATFDEAGIIVSLARPEGEAWCVSETVGISAEVGPMQLLIEKDFACMKPREGEDPSEMYPHPNAG